MLCDVRVHSLHTSTCVHVYSICIWSQSKTEYCLEVYCVLLSFTVSEAGSVALLHLRYVTFPTQVASYPNADWKWEHTIVLQCICTRYTFPQFGWDSWRLGKWKKVPHVWTKTGLYIAMELPECYIFPKHWTYFFRNKSVKTSADAPYPLSLAYMHCEDEVEPELSQ